MAFGVPVTLKSREIEGEKSLTTSRFPTLNPKPFGAAFLKSSCSECTLRVIPRSSSHARMHTHIHTLAHTQFNIYIVITYFLLKNLRVFIMISLPV